MITLSEHNRAEWSRMAADCYAKGRTYAGHLMSAAATFKAGARWNAERFDMVQAIYRAWLIDDKAPDGTEPAAPAWQELDESPTVADKLANAARPIRRRGYVNAPQSEMPIDGGFALIVDAAEDGARIAAELEEERRRKEAAAAAQLSLF